MKDFSDLLGFAYLRAWHDFMMAAMKVCKVFCNFFSRWVVPGFVYDFIVYVGDRIGVFHGFPLVFGLNLYSVGWNRTTLKPLRIFYIGQKWESFTEGFSFLGKT